MVEITAHQPHRLLLRQLRRKLLLHRLRKRPGLRLPLIHSVAQRVARLARVAALQKVVVHASYQVVIKLIRRKVEKLNAIKTKPI